MLALHDVLEQCVWWAPWPCMVSLNDVFGEQEALKGFCLYRASLEGFLVGFPVSLFFFSRIASISLRACECQLWALHSFHSIVTCCLPGNSGGVSFYCEEEGPHHSPRLSPLAEKDWTEEDRAREKVLMQELVTLIEQRNAIVNCLDEDRQR